MNQNKKLSFMRIGPILLWPQRWVANTHPPRR